MGDREVCAGIMEGTAWTEEGMKVNLVTDHFLTTHTL